MFKRILVFLSAFLILNLTANANILPATTEDISSYTIGMYQMPKNILVYSKPDTNSTVLYRANWDYASFKYIASKSTIPNISNLEGNKNAFAKG